MEFINLLESSSNEEKIAGIILCYKYIEENKELKSDILQRVLLIIKPSFFIQLFYTNFEFNEISLQDIIIILFEYIVEDISLLIQFNSYYEEILNISLTSSVSILFYLHFIYLY